MSREAFELLPCPFCGSKAEQWEKMVEEDEVAHKYWVVGCSDCYCEMESFAPCCELEEIVLIWNTRIAQAPVEDCYVTGEFHGVAQTPAVPKKGKGLRENIARAQFVLQGREYMEEIKQLKIENERLRESFLAISNVAHKECGAGRGQIQALINEALKESKP